MRPPRERLGLAVAPGILFHLPRRGLYTTRPHRMRICAVCSTGIGLVDADGLGPEMDCGNSRVGLGGWGSGGLKSRAPTPYCPPRSGATESNAFEIRGSPTTLFSF